MATWLTREDWGQKAHAGTLPADAALRKALTPDDIKAVEGEDRTLEFVLSTGTPDRDHDVIDPEGWKLTQYKKNPVILFAHDYHSLPIAKASKVHVEDGKLLARATFAPAEIHPFAETVFQLLKGGFLSATSVGFQPMKHVWNDARGGADFQEQELLEFSIVPVPAHPDALIVARTKGLPLDPLRAWAEEALTRLTGTPGFWLPLDLAERKKIWAGLAKGDHDDCPMGEDCPMRDKTRDQKPRVLPPEDGKCPAGYEMGDDGMCHEKAARGVLATRNGPHPLWLDLEAIEVPIFEIDGWGEASPIYDFDRDELRAVLREKIRGFVQESVTATIRSALSAARGRID